MKRGLFITFEGIDGSGKSTQIDSLAAKLESEGYRVLALRDPGGTEVSEQIRTLLLSVHNPIVPVAELLLYEAARAQIVREKIRPALEENRLVLMDRYYDSTTAYQGYGREIALEEVRQANKIATGGLDPDLTFFIDITWEEASRRLRLSPRDRLEQEDRSFFDRTRNGYLQIVRENPDRLKLIDGAAPMAVIEQSILEETRQVLKRSGYSR